jgi:hypothetical protein
MTWWDKVQKIYNEHGYIVMGLRAPASIGYRTTSVRLGNGMVKELPQPFVAIAESTREEYLSQYNAIDYPEARYFYRMVTD